MVVGMLIAVLVLGPLLMLVVLAVASNERAVAWLRKIARQLKRDTVADSPTPDNMPDAARDTPVDGTINPINTASGPTQQSA